MREKIYAFLAKLGITVFQKVFPDLFAKQPLKPTDRYIEYPFAMRNLPAPPARVLDVGCAGSFFPLLLAAFGYETYGMDIREYAIINKIKFENFVFVKEDIRNNSFPDNYFDAISAISTIEHIGLSGRYGTDEDLGGDKKALLEMKRIIKPAGSILVTVPFGRAQIIRPYNKIYDGDWIRRIIGDLKIEKGEYFNIDLNGDWYQCTKEEAANFDSTITTSPLCLLKLTKR